MFSRINEVDGICVYDDDRLARDFDMSIEQMFLLKRLGKKLYIARKAKVIDFNAQREEQLIHLISGWMAEQEREKIKQRQLEGIKRYRENNDSWGRPIKKVNWRLYDEYKSVGLSDNAISKIFRMDWRTLKERVNERNDE
jgi:DNA invertase Pin-like site-specific DNA recombinase